MYLHSRRFRPLVGNLADKGMFWRTLRYPRCALIAEEYPSSHSAFVGLGRCILFFFSSCDARRLVRGWVVLTEAAVPMLLISCLMHLERLFMLFPLEEAVLSVSCRSYVFPIKVIS